MFEQIQERPSAFGRFFQSDQFRIVAAIIMTSAVVLAVAFGFWATPYYAIWCMRSAAQNRDAAKFCSYIDFPLLRENLKGELNAKMLYEMGKNQNLKDNPFSGLAALAGPAMINNMVDGYVTPAAIERAFKEEGKPKDENVATQTFNKNFLNQRDLSFTSEYNSFNVFHILVTDTNKKTTTLVFERRALVSWQLVGMKLD